MSRLILNNRGISLLEVVIAILLVAFGVLAILSNQPSAWRMVGKSDYLGRGAGILHRALETREAWILNPCNAVPNGWPQQIIYVSGVQNGLASGDAVYTVNTTLSLPNPNEVQVTVTVTWTDQVTHNYRNLQESIIVTPQATFAYPVGCSNNSYAFPNPLPADF